MRRPVRLALLALLFLPTEALADSKPPAWPVRANVSLPLGASWGRERVHGFTWGFRGTLAAYPFDDGRGAGGFASGEQWGSGAKQHSGKHAAGGSHFHGDMWK